MKEIKYLYKIYENFHHSMIFRIRIQSAEAKSSGSGSKTQFFASQFRGSCFGKKFQLQPDLDPDLKHCALKQVAHVSQNLGCIFNFLLL